MPADSMDWSMAMHMDTWRPPADAALKQQVQHSAGAGGVPIQEKAPWEHLLGSAVQQERLATAYLRGQLLARELGAEVHGFCTLAGLRRVEGFKSEPGALYIRGFARLLEGCPKALPPGQRPTGVAYTL